MQNMLKEGNDREPGRRRDRPVEIARRLLRSRHPRRGRHAGRLADQPEFRPRPSDPETEFPGRSSTGVPGQPGAGCPTRSPWQVSIEPSHERRALSSGMKCQRASPMSIPEILHDPAAGLGPVPADAARPWDPARVAHLHRRAGFAASWGTSNATGPRGPEASLQRLLDGEPTALDGQPAVDFETIGRPHGGLSGWFRRPPAAPGRPGCTGWFTPLTRSASG